MNNFIWYNNINNDFNEFNNLNNLSLFNNSPFINNIKNNNDMNNKFIFKNKINKDKIWIIYIKVIKCGRP